jgi:hypothetical protein
LEPDVAVLPGVTSGSVPVKPPVSDAKGTAAYTPSVGP